MNIVSNYSNKYNSFTGKIVNLDDRLPKKPKPMSVCVEKSPVDPEYYQALNIVTPSNSFDMSDEEIRAFFDEKTIENCFLVDGKIDKSLVSKFISIYKSIIEKDFKTEEDIVEFAKKAMDETGYSSSDSISYMPITRQISERAMELHQLGDSSMRDGIIKKMHFDVAKSMLDTSKERTESIQQEAYAKTVVIFGLSKTDDGFDFSSIDEKLDFVLKVYGMAEDLRSGILNHYFEKIKDSNGRFDAKLASKVFDIIYEAGCAVPCEDVASVLNECIQKDPDNEENITNAMFHIVQNSYSTESKEYLSQLMNTCFDENGRYDGHREQVLMELFQALEIWLETNYDENASIYTDSDIKAFSNISISLILKYFKDAKNEGVDFESFDNPNFLPYKYIKNELKNVKLGGCF